MAPTVELEGETRTTQLLPACLHIARGDRAHQSAGTPGVGAEVEKTPMTNVCPVPGKPLQMVEHVHSWRADRLPAVDLR